MPTDRQAFWLVGCAPLGVRAAEEMERYSRVYKLAPRSSIPIKLPALIPCALSTEQVPQAARGAPARARLGSLQCKRATTVRAAHHVFHRRAREWCC